MDVPHCWVGSSLKQKVQHLLKAQDCCPVQWSSEHAVHSRGVAVDPWGGHLSWGERERLVLLVYIHPQKTLSQVTEDIQLT